MFLFTSLPDKASAAAEPKAQTPAIEAIRQGATQTGVGFDYLVRTAQRESSLDPSAKARTSSASGLFQFIEQTWLSLVRQDGGKHGLGEYADAIEPQPGGRLGVSDAALRERILALRHDPKAAAVMAGELTRRNQAALSSALGRAPNEGELYTAHVLGAGGAIELIRGASVTPKGDASALFPEAAAANRSIFFEPGGKARTLAQVQAILAGPSLHAGSSAPAVAPTSAAAYARDDGPVMFGLFRTEGRRGPVSEAVAKLWTSPARAKGGADDAPRYFPRGIGKEADGAGTLANVAPAALSAATGVVRPAEPGFAPLPPRREPVESAASPVSPVRQRPAAGARRPLDLSTFMAWRPT